MKFNELSYLHMKKCLNDPVFNIISQVGELEKTPVFVIGGFVRDAILKRPSKDIDIVALGKWYRNSPKGCKENRSKSKCKHF
jgi:hypothetical protein